MVTGKVCNPVSDLLHEDYSLKAMNPFHHRVQSRPLKDLCGDRIMGFSSVAEVGARICSTP